MLVSMPMKILAIETSCDETAMAVVEASEQLANPQFTILSNIVSSQIEVHRPFGGVVPSLAKREHLKNLPIVLDQIKEILNLKSLILNPDCIAVTVGPGLEPALWTGINFAKELSKKLQKPLMGINHLEGHIYSNWLMGQKIEFPAIVLIVSGGHTILLRMDDMKKWEKLGETQDDAVGEAFDKVAKMLGLPYPGGPEVEKAARGGNSNAVAFPRPMLHSGDYNFSFSGLKTAVLYYLKELKTKNYKLKTNDICASFQRAAIDVLATKTMRAVEECGARSVMLCGGVAANKALQDDLRFKIQDLGVEFFVPELQYNTDNAVMIATAAYLGNHYPTESALPNLNL